MWKRLAKRVNTATSLQTILLLVKLCQSLPFTWALKSYGWFKDKAKTKKLFGWTGPASECIPTMLINPTM